MADLTKLCELQEQASPGPWGDNFGLVNDGSGAIILRVGYDDDLGIANAKLAALAPHLLPLAEALERAIHPANDPTAWDDAKGVLEALQEALG